MTGAIILAVSLVPMALLALSAAVHAYRRDRDAADERSRRLRRWCR